ncbi:MAG: CVNH domain-containing protein [Thermodesulfobacteriota bacterium]
MNSTSPVKRIAALSFALMICFIISNVYANAQNLPPGSYKDTCRSINVYGGNLTAQCQKADGSWKNTSIQYYDCEGGITNENGNLTCKHKPKPDKPLPRGSYKQSCKDSYVEGKWLYSKCKRTNGNWNNTSIKYADCGKDIWNNNGVLTCGGGTSNLPKGSYKETCKDAYVDGKWLYAKCRKNNGSWYSTSIKYTDCNKDIWNDNGVLTCGGGGGSGLPKGSYKESCKNIYVEGNVLEADCLNRNGKYSHTSIKYKNCNKGVWNDKGTLRCN